MLVRHTCEWVSRLPVPPASTTPFIIVLQLSQLSGIDAYYALKTPGNNADHVEKDITLQTETIPDKR
jgi:hypothetical protein